MSEVRNLMGSYHVKSGIYHYYRNEVKQAVDFFRKALRDEPSLADFDRRIARYYLTQTFVESAERSTAKGDLEGAVRDYHRAVEVSPGFPDIRLKLGEALENLGRREDAVAEYRQAATLNEDYEAARAALAFCLLRMGRDDEAAEAFSQALDLKLRLVRAPYERGLARLREGMALEAEEFLREVFLAAPHRFEDRYRSALERLKAEDWENALDLLDQAVSLSPKFGDLYNYRGVALCEMGRTDEAIAAFRRSIVLNPDYLVAKLNLAFAYLRAGSFKEAEAQLETVLEQDATVTAAAAKLEELRTGRAADAKRTGSRGGAR